VYSGHAAIALALSRRETRVPVVLLVLAAYGPDWLDLLLTFPAKSQDMAVYTHSLSAVLIGASLAAGLYAATRRPGARILFLAWLLHWPADLFTGRKPVVFSQPLIGLDLYNLPWADFALEALLVAIGCAIYAGRFAPRAELRRVVVILGAALIVLQAAVDVALWAVRKSEWTPSFATGGWQPHLPTSLRGHGS
jgi:hypothetical protein